MPEIDWDKQKKREKIGLVVFVVGIALIFAAVFAYINVGHNLDLAATGIDAHIGQLNGYSTIVFKGDNSKRIIKGEENNEEECGENQEPANKDNVNYYYRAKGSTVCNIKCSDYSAYEKGEIFQRGNWKIGVISISQNQLNDILDSKKQQILKENPSLLQNKDSSSDRYDGSEHKSFTSKPVKTKTPQMLQLQNLVSSLYAENKADLVIVLAPHQDVVDVLDRVDCVIAKNVYDDIPEEGKSLNSTYIMRIPENAKMGAILSSPAKMLSGNVFTYIDCQTKN